jgi:hypothetical protein
MCGLLRYLADSYYTDKNEYRQRRSFEINPKIIKYGAFN